MELLSDNLAVLGSRHGLVAEPHSRQARVMRFEPCNWGRVVHICAALEVDGQSWVLPLTPDGELPFFVEQRMSPCTMKWTGIEWSTAVKFSLTVIVPFRPRDTRFSTTPTLQFLMEASPLEGVFRWAPPKKRPSTVTLALSVSGPEIAVEETGEGSLDLLFKSQRFITEEWAAKPGETTKVPMPQRDRVFVLEGRREGQVFRREVDFMRPEAQRLQVGWATWSGPVAEICGSPRPFRYSEWFSSLEAVVDWHTANPHALERNARAVDGVISRNSFSVPVNRLLSQTLHSYALNTWWVIGDDRDPRAERLLVREGSCSALSTVDLEFTQAPFYLAVWPELLGHQLDFWPIVAVDGRRTLGDRGAGTRFLQHDVGKNSVAGKAVYGHEMEVEETANYLLLAHAHWARTGDDAILRKHADVLADFLKFLHAADTTGNGVPDLGMANSVDDGAPAIQFGREQTYLAVKTLGALLAGARILRHLGRPGDATCERQAELIRETIAAKGWVGDHFAVLLNPSADGVVRPNSGKPIEANADGTVPGWDAAHIFTANTLPVCDMVGLDLSLDEKRIVMDLRVATQRCLAEYGCTHSDYRNIPDGGIDQEFVPGWIGQSSAPGWISMNMLRDLAALRRGIDLGALAGRYWEWQTTTNSRETKLFFETFNGNNLCFYPRGVAIWGIFDAMAGRTINLPAGIDRESPPFPGTVSPRLLDRDWNQM